MSKAIDHIQDQLDEAAREATQHIQAELMADTPEAKKAASEGYDRALVNIDKLVNLMGATKNDEAQPTPDMMVDSLLLRMEDAAESGNLSEYKRLREQRADLVKRFGRGGSVTSSKTYKTGSSTLSGNIPDLLTKMEAAANSGDMTLYKQLRKQRNEAMAV